MMEISQYVLFLKNKAIPKYYVYQTLFRKLLEVSEQIYLNLLDKKFYEIPKFIKDDLQKQGILVKDLSKHQKIYEHYYYKAKFSPSTLGVVIVPGFGCNLRCTYCYQGIYPKESEPMKDEILNKLIRYLKKINRLKIGFYGGEPTVFENHLLKILDALDPKVTNSVSLMTNGFILDNKLVKHLTKFRNVMVQITFAGDKEIHNKLRPTVTGKGSFDKIFSNLQKLVKETDFTILIRIDVSEENFNSIPLLLKRLIHFRSRIKIGFEKILPPHEIPCDWNISSVGDEKLLQLFNLAETLGFKFPIGENGDLPLFNFCSALTINSITINPRGEVFKCMGFADLNHMKCGEFSEDGIIWNDNYFDWMSRNPLKIKECRECPVLPLCNGGCAMEAFHKYGTIHARGCDEWKGYVKKVIIPYLSAKYSLPQPLYIEEKENVILNGAQQAGI